MVAIYGGEILRKAHVQISGVYSHDTEPFSSFSKVRFFPIVVMGERLCESGFFNSLRTTSHFQLKTSAAEMQVEQFSLLVDYMRPAERQNSLAQDSHCGSHANYEEKSNQKLRTSVVKDCICTCYL